MPPVTLAADVLSTPVPIVPSTAGALKVPPAAETFPADAASPCATNAIFEALITAVESAGNTMLPVSPELVFLDTTP